MFREEFYDDVPDAITKDAISAISDYCESREGKCRGCRYSIKWLIKDYKGDEKCIFNDTPCIWW